MEDVVAAHVLTGNLVHRHVREADSYCVKIVGEPVAVSQELAALLFVRFFRECDIANAVLLPVQSDAEQTILAGGTILTIIASLALFAVMEKRAGVQVLAVHTFVTELAFEEIQTIYAFVCFHGALTVEAAFEIS